MHLYKGPMIPDLDSLSAALDSVADPLGGGGLLATGRATPPRVSGEAVTVVLDATGLDEAQRETVEQAVTGALEAAGATKVRVAMTAERAGPIIVAVASGKGGVGKSTLAANLAIALARSGARVGLVDADIHGPSVPLLMGTGDARPTAVGEKLQPLTAHGVKVLSLGMIVEPGKAIAWRGPMAGRALEQLIEANWGSASILIVDMPPGTGDIQLSLLQRHRPAGAVIVSTPQDLALIDARRAVDLFKSMHVPILGLVENMAGYACPHCGEVSDPFGSGGAEVAARELGVPFLGRVPLDPQIRAASDEGQPPAAGDGPGSDAYRGIADGLRAALNL
jgi:ATP-binding protein involved in chromosome partitioning